MAVDRRLVLGPRYALGEFHCPAGSPLWTQENRIRRGPLFVIPSVPVEIAHDPHQPFIADANQVVFYNHDQPYRRRLLDERGDRCLFIALPSSDIRDVLSALALPVGDQAESPFAFSYGPSRPEVVVRQHAVARHVFSSTHRDDLYVQEQLLLSLRELAADAGRHLRRPRQPPPNPARRRRGEDAVRRAQEVLAVDFRNPMSLAELGAQVDLSPFHLARLFKAHHGCTVHAYRDRLRVLEGLPRVLDGERLLDVALDVGYSSHSHFTAAFRRTFARAPSELRAQVGAATRAACRSSAGR